MLKAGFTIVFIGIETLDTDSLLGIHKNQNTRNDLIESCHKITRMGLQIMSGFIMGFDNERPGAGKRIREFIEETGILVAVVTDDIFQTAPCLRLLNSTRCRRTLL